MHYSFADPSSAHPIAHLHSNNAPSSGDNKNLYFVASHLVQLY